LNKTRLLAVSFIRTHSFPAMKLHPHLSRRRASGFTLVEIVLVLAIIALLLGVAVKGLTGVLDTGKDVRARADIDTFGTALITYQSVALRYPTTEQGLKALVDKPSSAPQPRQWRRMMEELKPDPWGNDYYYYFPGKKNGATKPDIGSRGPDGIEGNEDDVGNWAVK
jgi:general secretion pathway protein G